MIIIARPPPPPNILRQGLGLLGLQAIVPLQAKAAIARR